MFLDWLDPPEGIDWLDVGCGTGLFTELIAKRCAPASLIGIDPVAAQISYAKSKPIATKAEFRTDDAQALPFKDTSFDAVASALVINFIPDRPRALSEMRRVVRGGGIVGGYVWDFAAELSPSGPFRLGLRAFADVPPLPGTEDSTLHRLQLLFEQAGFVEIATTSFDVTVEFPNFETFWTAQTPSYAPTTKLIAAMGDDTRGRVRDAIRAGLQPSSDGTIRYPARANAIRARKN